MRGLGGTLAMLGAIACASEPSPATSDASSDSGAPVTGSITHDASTGSSASSTTTGSTESAGSIESTESTDSSTDDTRGTTSPDTADDLPVPDVGTGERPTCHPLEPDCPEAQGCYPIDGVWQCAPDASGDAGAYGEPCDSDDGCDPGLVCLGTETVPPGLPCEGAAGCCTVLCDFSDPAASLDCPSAAEGQLCLPWYEGGQAPPGFEDVGVCSLWP